MRSRHLRGLSLVESLLSITLFSVLTLSGIQLWSFSTERSLRDASLAQLTLQANQLLDILADDIRQAVYCEARTVGSNPVLMIALPELGVDRTADGSLDDFMPTTSTPEAAVRTRPALFRFYGSADDTWNMAGTPRWITRVDLPRDRWNSSASQDTNFSQQRLSPSRTVPRWRLIESVTYTVFPADRRVSITVVASAQAHRRGEEFATGAAGGSTTRITVTRSVNWENGL